MPSIITLTTDFGTQDGYVGAMKGKILSIHPEAMIVDISHDIEPQNVRQCSWNLVRSTCLFPQGSIHLVVVDPGVGSDRRAVLIRSDERWYVGPDNGVFSEIIREKGTEEIYEIEKETEWWKSHASFDGLALFSPAAAHLSKGLEPQKFCKPISSMLNLFPNTPPSVEGKTIQGRIVMFDRFGNAITNISKRHLLQLEKPSPYIHCQKQTFSLVSHYEEGKDKPAIAIINSDGFLELSVYSGSARQQFKLEMDQSVSVR